MPDPTPDERIRIPMSTDEAVYLGPAKDQTCEIHDWPTAGLARRLVTAMRDRHPTGINSCRDCIARAKEDLDA